MPAKKQSETKTSVEKKASQTKKSSSQAGYSHNESSGNSRNPEIRSGKNAAKNSKSSHNYESSENNRGSVNLFHQIFPYIILFFAVFIIICFVSEKTTGWLGMAIRTVLYGLFAGGAFIVPILLAVSAFFWKKDAENGTIFQRALFGFIILIFTSILIQIINGNTDTLIIQELWSSGLLLHGGGAIGGILGGLLFRMVGFAGSIIISASMLFIFGIFMFGLTPHVIWVYIAYYLHEGKEKSKAAKLEKAQQRRAVRNTQYDNSLGVNVPVTDQNNENGDMQPHTSGTQSDNYNIDIDDTDICDINPYTVSHSPEDSGNTHVRSSSNAKKNDSGTVSEPDNASIIDAAVFDEVLKKNASGVTSDAVDSNINASSGNPAQSVKNEAVSPEKTSVPHYMMPDGSVNLEAIFSDGVASRTAKSSSSSVSNNGNSQLHGLDSLILEATKEIELNAGQKNEFSANGANTPQPLEIERGKIINNSADKKDHLAAAPKPPYAFPPISLLNLDTSPKNMDISEELHTNAVKLVDTLNSFKVRTRIVHVSRGPTITRYELAPEEGVRVRSIINLVDDIALNLATSGVRIEAPIPGKQAVGIEVPNRNVSTVYLRELVDTEKFRSSTSKISVSLGVNVANEPIFVDIAKMPHLLIAGATGMGKSVCINSMIVSLLYKASPEEVKLILIDPKKVELNIYNGLPHLLVPVVSDPKKAAGSLHWAVTEMERRFELIEEAGVRDIKNYNALIKDDPELEYMPQVVIIIDELADLMMTAPDDVEESICRLAQKARAAGMHIIIGTQRPSVDVITGLIKANIPSRIAFTVASQIDSRTIIDISGAEKLIGRGDMLYAPVGSQKPIRVQGAFVSEQEVIKICDFIKRENESATYSNDVIDTIEKEAAKCGQGKKGGAASFDSDDSGESDAMLKPAIELAVESGKISTSLIQRRLSLGYGRAAKLIDEMERKGIVSPPEGQKPRTVLISKAQYMEMVLNKDDI